VLTPGTGNAFPLDGSGDLRARTCLDFRAGFFGDDFCGMRMRVDMRLSTSPGLNLAEASVSATWDATVDGGTDALKQITTTAAYWGEPLNPLLTSRPSLATPVPEAGVWWMVLAGLGAVAWRQRRASPRPGPSGQPQVS
jgi:MYXO-CTERM domain-containing protein